jgi:hypothetical protein
MRNGARPVAAAPLDGKVQLDVELVFVKTTPASPT